MKQLINFTVFLHLTRKNGAMPYQLSQSSQPSFGANKPIPIIFFIKEDLKKGCKVS